MFPRGMTRRGLLKSGMAMTAAGLMLPAGMAMAQAEPKKGGVFRIGLGHGSTTDSYDPGLWEQLYVQTFAAARVNYLIEIAADGNLAPDLAESWDSADGMTWVFKIREGVSFHSDKPMTPDDVAASLNFHRGDASTSAVKPFFDPVTDIKVDGQNVVITLNAANADFPYLMSDYQLPILPSAEGKIDPNTPDGTGSYIVESYEPGVQATMNRNPNYWKADRAHFDQIIMLTILDPAARLNALMTGEVDLVDQVDPASISLLEASGVSKILSVSGNAHYCFPMDARAAPFSDNNVRLALKYAFDRQELVDKVLAGHGSVANDNPIGPANRYFFAEMEAKTCDPDKAKFHLKEAGMDTLEVTLSAANAAFSGAVDAAVLMSEKAAAAGITITVDRVPDDGYWDNVWMKKPYCASYWGGRPVEDQMFTTAYQSGAAWNESFWSNEAFDKLLVAARSELDDAKRREMYHEMQRLGFAARAGLQAAAPAHHKPMFRDMPLTASFGLAVTLLYVVVAIFAPVIAPFGEGEVLCDAYLPWGAPHYLGTDKLGRDMATRLIYGARNTVGIAFATTALAFVVGSVLGIWAALVGGWLDQTMSRCVDALMAIPALIFSLLLLTIFGTSGLTLILVIAAVDATRVFRLARSVSQGIVVMDYIEAARLRGETSWRLIRREILPNAMAPLVAEFGLRFCFVFLAISALSFLGLGIKPPTADWGSMVRENATLITFGNITPLLPAGAIALLTVAVNFVVDWQLHRASGLKE